MMYGGCRLVLCHCFCSEGGTTHASRGPALEPRNAMESRKRPSQSSAADSPETGLSAEMLHRRRDIYRVCCRSTSGGGDHRRAEVIAKY